MEYQVIVSNIGTTYRGGDKNLANIDFASNVQKSKNNEGRWAGETVTLFEDLEVIEEYDGVPVNHFAPKDFTPQVREAQASYPVHQNEKPYALYDRYDQGTDFGTLIATEDKARIVGQALNAFNRMSTYLEVTAAISGAALEIKSDEVDDFWPKWAAVGSGGGVEYYHTISQFGILCTEMFFAAFAAFPDGLCGVWDYEVAEEFGVMLRKSILDGTFDEDLLCKAMFADACEFIKRCTGEECPEALMKEFRRIANI